MMNRSRSSNRNEGAISSFYSSGQIIRQRPRPPNSLANSGGNITINDIDDNSIKYDYRKSNGKIKRNTRIIWGAMISIVSLFGGFVGKHYIRTLNSLTSQLDKAENLITYRNWKPRILATTDEYNIIETRQKQHMTSLRRNKNNVVHSQKTKDTITYWWKRGNEYHPMMITLEKWNTLPSKNADLVKNLDSDYGGLTFQSIRNKKEFARTILIDENNQKFSPGAFDSDGITEPDEALEERTPRHHKMYSPNGTKIWPEDATLYDIQNYYDDDSIQVLSNDNTQDDKTKSRACVSPEFSTLYFPTCNNFHSQAIGRAFDDPEIVEHPRPGHDMFNKYLASGYYRDTWLLQDNPWIWPSRYPSEKGQHDDVSPEKYDVLDSERTNEMIVKGYRSAVMKTLRTVHKYDDEHFREMRVEAIIMERMTKSPRIMNIYGHCGFSTLTEVVPIEFEEAMVFGEGYESNDVVEARNEDDVHPFNNFTSSEKLRFALEMAESLAELHGFKDGVIVHDDVQMCQWLRTPDGRLKLGDFNRATIMQWDVVHEEYCEFNNGLAMGNYRAPEEFAARNLNEQIDIYSFGNNIYAMITGLWNFYDVPDDDVVQKKIINRELPYVDHRYRKRSFAEEKLIELMEKCWVYDPDERINIFYAVDYLRKAVQENEHLARVRSIDRS